MVSLVNLRFRQLQDLVGHLHRTWAELAEAAVGQSAPTTVAPVTGAP